MGSHHGEGPAEVAAGRVAVAGNAAGGDATPSPVCFGSARDVVGEEAGDAALPSPGQAVSPATGQRGQDASYAFHGREHGSGPVAAAPHRRSPDPGPDVRRLLVHGLGGAFDAAVVRGEGDGGRVVCADGDRRLGGAEEPEHKVGAGGALPAGLPRGPAQTPSRSGFHLTGTGLPDVRGRDPAGGRKTGFDVQTGGTGRAGVERAEEALAMIRASG
ncbi:hypothetical protein ACIRPH_04800 [Nocardiopsis sp. NPDC101807]|uniref:hypothetical protein n=1 Tax=Nocardiopsis sp. NPDC101807 TaxID=3364339 RepID=UPI0037FE2467